LIAQASLAPIPLVTVLLAFTGVFVLLALVVRQARGQRLFAASSGSVRRGDPTALAGLAVALLFAYACTQFVVVRGGPVAGTIGALLGLVLLWMIWRSTLRHLLVSRGGLARATGAGLVALWATLPVVYGLLIVGAKIFGDQTQEAVEMIDDRRVGWQMVVVTALVLAPLFEEVIFRGLLYTMFRRWGRWTAILATAALFGLIHIDTPTACVPLAVLGGVLAWMVESTGSLVPSITAHAAFNFLTISQLIWKG